MLPTAFDAWLDDTIAREGPFTVFFILFEEATTTIVPIASSYLHIVGPDVRWDEILGLLDRSGLAWHSVGVFAAKAADDGPLGDAEARQRLATLQQAVLRDRLTVRKGELFDRRGRRLALEPDAGMSIDPHGRRTH